MRFSSKCNLFWDYKGIIPLTLNSRHFRRRSIGSGVSISVLFYLLFSISAGWVARTRQSSASRRRRPQRLSSDGNKSNQTFLMESNQNSKYFPITCSTSSLVTILLPLMFKLLITYLQAWNEGYRKYNAGSFKSTASFLNHCLIYHYLPPRTVV